ncbi:type II toxin-antitoxin system PemK/MazF family toxin [Trueperella pyogenes]|uniref:type II toxin-antitoxin system PemK/MazF family toxin n=1 Tax=Trueperella pyogenes TaxID=1661 RepID=UPI003252718A
MSFMDTLASIAKSVGRSLTRDLIKKASDELARSRKSVRGKSAQRAASSAGTRRAQRRPSGLPGPHDQAIEWPISRLGLPAVEYHPSRNGYPDPGEVVWAWVPFDENDGRGKDRPVLVLANIGEHVIFAQMSSKDHDQYADYESSQGRAWFDIGSGAWDSRGRESEVRLDRLLVAHVGQVRREGATLDRARYDDVVCALKDFHG